MWPESFHNRSSKRIVTFACRKIYMYIYISIISAKYRSLFLTKKPITLAYIASWSKTPEYILSNQLAGRPSAIYVIYGNWKS